MTVDTRKHTPVTENPQQTHIPADATRLEGTLRLRNGKNVAVRPIQSDDAGRLQAMHSRLSIDAIVNRFFRVVPHLTPEMAEHLTRLDYENRMALVATIGEGDDERIIGVVRYERISPESAEVAFIVEDAWQGQSISTSLLHMLASYAQRRGFRTFVAVTMGSNIRMLDVLRHCGYPLTRKYMGSEIEVYLDITEAPQPAFAVSQ